MLLFQAGANGGEQLQVQIPYHTVKKTGNGGTEFVIETNVTDRMNTLALPSAASNEIRNNDAEFNNALDNYVKKAKQHLREVKYSADLASENNNLIAAAEKNIAADEKKIDNFVNEAKEEVRKNLANQVVAQYSQGSASNSAYDIGDFQSKVVGVVGHSFSQISSGDYKQVGGEQVYANGVRENLEAACNNYILSYLVAVIPYLPVLVTNEETRKLNGEHEHNRKGGYFLNEYVKSEPPTAGSKKNYIGTYVTNEQLGSDGWKKTDVKVEPTLLTDKTGPSKIKR